MSVVHRLVGYDRKTEELALELEIPERLLPWIRDLVHPDDADPNVLASYPIEEAAAQRVAGSLGQPLWRREPTDFFVEAVAE